MDEGIHLEIDGQVAIITINRPGSRNALDRQSVADLGRSVAWIDADETVASAVLTGAGETFCAGADLREMADTDANYTPWAGADGPLANPCAKPVIAAVEGHAVAGGLGLALWADLRIASKTAVFGVFCRRFGVPMSDGTPTRLPTVIGRGRALDMLLTGRPVDGAEAYRMGLADRLVPPGEAFAEAMAIARDIAGFPPLALAADRRAAWAAFDADETTRLAEEDRGAAQAKAAEATRGATRFRDGAGRGGSFES